MKKVILAVLVMALASFTPAFALEADYIPMTFIFPIVTTDAATEATSTVTFVAPENITIKSIYVTETDGVTANATNSASINLLDDGTITQTYTTNLVSLVAMTPKAFTLVTTAGKTRIAKGSVVTVTAGKNGDGVALTTPVVQLDYTIGW